MSTRGTSFGATRTRCRGKIPPNTLRNAEITLTLGAPNYLERAFIKKCHRAGEPFPVKKLQYHFVAPPRKKKRRR
jgi:hypothetical protein